MSQYLATDPIVGLLRNFFGGEYANQDFVDWNNEQALKRRQDLADHRRNQEIEQSFPDLDPRERMLLEYQMSKGGGATPTSTPESITPPQAPPPVRRDAVSVPVPPRGGPSGFAGRYDPSPDYVEQAAPVREPWEVEHEANWAKFQEMNPDLDYEAVARQSGGNVKGGSFSAVERKDVPKAQTDEEFIRWVNEDLPKYTATSMLDQRSRDYNPEAAQMIFDRLSQERGDAAQMLYSRGQELRGQADMEKAKMLKRQAEFSRTPQGQMQSTIDFILQSVDPGMNADIYDKAIRAKMALMNGDTITAQEILQDITDTANNAQGQANQAGAPVIG